MDLIADLGNTRCHLVAFDGERAVARADVAQGPAAELERAWDAFLASLPAKPARVALSSVNPALREPFARWVQARLGVTPLVLGESLGVKIPLDVDAPARVGGDRLVNALWAVRRRPGRAVVVADFGTAVSLAVVSSSGAFKGGAIAPGLSTAAAALAERTALLPRVRVDARPAGLGRDTERAIAAGVYYGAAGLVERLVPELERELGERVHVVATGGDAALVAPACRAVHEVVPGLTLEGLRIALAEHAA